MLRSSQAHIWINVLIISLLYVPPAISNQSDIDDEVPTTLKLIGHDPDFVPYRSNITMICKTRLVASTLWWTFKDANLTEDSQYILEREAENINPELDKTYEISILHILDVDFSHIGEYKCHAIKVTDEGSELDFAKITLNLAIDVSIVEFTSSPPSADILPVDSSESYDHRLSIRAKLHDAMRLSCIIDGYPMLEVGWRKDGQIISPEMAELINTTTIAVQDMPTNGTRWYTEIIMSHLERRDNGTYECYGKTAVSEDDQKMAILVLDKPQVSIESVKAIGRSSIYLQWRVNDGNAPDGLHYRVQYTTPGGEHWHYYRHDINGTLRSAVLRDAFTNNTAYTIRLAAINSEGESPYATSMDLVVTLAEDPVFVPLVKVTGVTVSSITISWTEPGPAVAPYIHYYHLTSQLTPDHPTVTGDTGTNATSGNVTEMDSLSAPLEAIVPAREGHHLYMLSDLRPATTYKFQVAACSEYSRECGPQSVATLGTTNDGMAGPPVAVHAECRYDVASGTSAVLVTWRAPAEPNGRIVSYNVNLEGNATFINDLGLVEETTWGPKVTSISASTLMARFYNVSANTNYTVRVAAVTRAKRNGVLVERHCRMPVTLPDRQRLAKVTWRKLETEDGRWIFKVQVPRVSERNGPICCYRVYLVRMESQQTLAELPAPAQLEVVSFREAHRTPKGGAYVAEMFTSSSFHNEVFLGDDQQIYNDTSNALGLTTVTNTECDQCIGLRPYNSPAAANGGHSATVVITTQPSTVSSVSSKENNATSAQQNRVRREQLSDPLPPRDGLLDYNSNYTSFVEIVVHDPEQSTVDSSNGNNLATLAAYSSYLVMMNPGPEVVEAPPASSTRLVVQVLCGLVFVALVLLAALCLLREYTKQAHAQAVEMITFRTSLRNLRGRQRLISLNPPDMCPIPLNSLTAAYLERHRDSDYGFQQEFELLPDRFTDRTTRASDARENVYKNRYPDIKAYDQTRVKLSQVDSIAGSDYVNANFVLGYKERRKFICAQGPMDTTVTEFWRMIWEQHLELVLMLTNLEEYSKTKCAKYWPDKADIDKVFGDFTVTHVSETRYSDYILRELRVTLRRNGSGNNGTLAAAMSSSPTSPLAAHCEEESRTIVQYHYLVWKDFMAPEHPHGIIRFIKRMNEAATHSAPEERGAILVHCSAGVGRTGTLVALDCLLQQLHDEGQVAIFNTICELRHQRNFLVQSLKQFIFIYRALMEVSQYGDTEIPISELKSTVEKLKICDKDKVRSKMEDDFENIRNAYEDRKSCSVASGVENQDKNRCDTVIPYDRNRVILTPLSGREHSTYINATFIEGYDNSESFIIAQDPLECTIPDFWRMIAEQGISVVVMLSELGDNKCPRYWPEDERCYDHITVRYVQAESCPYYTRREMFVRSRDGEDVRVVHLQYHGWPTVDGEVPEVTRGLIELVDHAQSALTPHGSPTTSPTSMVVHCHMGADRSSMFVALSILVQQLRVERRADIFTVTRKLRSQRQEMISTYPQYEFLHRAIVNYAELHGLCDT